MQIINPILTNNTINNDGANDLLDDIDKKILSIATTQYTNDIYGLTDIVNLDQYDALCEYKEILIDKLMGCNCLDVEENNSQHLIYIMSQIQKTVNSY